MQKCVGVLYVSQTGVLCKRFVHVCVWASISERACVLHVNVLLCLCAAYSAGVLPELQATSAGDCSLSTAINLAADRGLERQGAGGWSEGCCRQRVDGGRRERRTCRDGLIHNTLHRCTYNMHKKNPDHKSACHFSPKTKMAKLI